MRNRIPPLLLLAIVLSLAGCRDLSTPGNGVAQVGSAPASVTPSASTTATAASGLPDVRGRRLSEATTVLKGSGYVKLSIVDSTGKNRVVIDPDNWVVTDESPEPGSTVAAGQTVVLGVRKPTDGVGPSSVVTGVMPNVVCMNLQDAQDTLQRAGFFDLHSDDGTGAGRHQILDRDWVVIAQSVPVGTRGGALLKITLTVVKYGEPTGSSGCVS